jgi:cephalosporin hydroxylase
MIGWGAAHYRPGASLRSWRDYLTNAEIIGIDIQPDTQFFEERIRTYLCDSTDPDAVRQLDDEIGLDNLDIIIDDGLHDPHAQLSTMRNLFPLLASSGLYVIEDVVENGLFDMRKELSDVIGNSVLLWTGVKLNPVFIRKIAS